MNRRQVYAVGTCVVALAAVSCGGSSQYTAPAQPEATIRGFLNAVQSNSLVAMGELWGGTRGPAVSYMDREELEKRLTVIRSYLVHEEFEILGPSNQASLSDSPNQRTVEVRLSRAGCTPVVPFTLIRYRGGWLVWEIDLEAAGNPMRRCR